MRTNARIYGMRTDDGSLKLGRSRDPKRCICSETIRRVAFQHLAVTCRR